jgi:hypothetical protein
LFVHQYVPDEQPEKKGDKCRPARDDQRMSPVAKSG